MKKAKTGDLILFEGEGPDARFIRCMSASNEWSHVGVVIVYDGVKLVTEAYPTVIDKDLIRDREHKGVQFVNLRTRLENYPSKRVAYRPLIGNKVNEKNTKVIIDWFKRIPEEEIPQYNKALWDFAEYGLRCDDDDNIHGDVQYYVCTSWAAHILMSLDVFNKTNLPGNYLLSDYGMSYRSIPTTNKGFTYGPIYYQMLST
jgi:hypothetical protein